MAKIEPVELRRLEAAPDDSESQRARELADTSEARKLKVKLAAGYRILSRYKMDQGVAGHISLRVPGAPEYFWVNPFGLFFNEVRADNLVLVNSAGETLEGHPL